MTYSKEEKAIWLEDWRRSGKPAWSYAKENGLIPQTFTNWTKPSGKTDQSLVEVSAPKVQSARFAGEMLIEKGEVRIRVPLTIGGSELRMIINVLGGAA
jgi:hypothetical protein